MLRWAIIALVAALILAALGFGGLGAIAWQIGIVLGVIALILFVWHLLTGRAV